MGDESTFQPFDRTGLLRRAAPFIGAMWLALVIYPLPPHGGDSDAFVTAVALNVIILVAVLIVPWRRLGPMAGVLPPLAYLLVIALLRQADGGGSSSYGALLMLPIFWLALYGSPQQLAVGFAGLATVFVVPVFLIGAPDYPPSEWSRALVWLCVAPIIGFTVQSLVREQRKRAEENLRRADELQVSQEETRKLVVSMAAVTEATRELARTPDAKVAREIICKAACTVTGARFAKLMERSPDGEIVMTAKHGLESSPPLTVPVGEEASGADTVFLSKKPLFVEDARGDDRVLSARRVGDGRRVDALRARSAQRGGGRGARRRLGARGRRLQADRCVDADARRRDSDGSRAPRPARTARGGRADR